MLNCNANKVPMTEAYEADDVDYVRVLHSLGETPQASLVKSAQGEVESCYGCLCAVCQTSLTRSLAPPA
jgi:hypothetical protein